MKKEEIRKIWIILGKLGQVWTSLGKFWQVWASLGKFGQVRTRQHIRKIEKKGTKILVVSEENSSG